MPTHTVCKASELPVGSMKAFSAGNARIVLYHLEDGFFATQASCTHVFAPLAKGRIVDGCQVRCPFHRARFDIRTGRVVEWANFPPGVQLLNVLRSEKALKTYKVSVIKGDVRVTV
jgi:3-phenylpropionate/trans-cinnamate dioxygenase ferredoxin component